MEMSTVPAQAPLQSDTVKSVPLLFIFSPEHQHSALMTRPATQ